MVFVCYSTAPCFPSLLVVYQHTWLVHTADLICGVVGARRCLWVPVNISVIKFKGSFVLGGLKFCVLIWWEKGRAWSKLVICVLFFCKCLNTTSWSWHAGVGHLPHGCISFHFIQVFRSQWTWDLQCLAGNSAGLFQPLHKSWNLVPVLGASAVLDHEIPTATLPLWNIKLFWPRVAPLGSCADCPTLQNGESKLSYTTSHYVHQCFHFLRWKSVFIPAQEPFRLSVQPLPLPWAPEACQEPSADFTALGHALQIAPSCWRCWAWHI